MTKKTTGVKYPPIPLVGQFFHSLNKETGKIEWQGVVGGNPEPGWYYIQLFEWAWGNPSTRRLIRIEDMKDWLFYGDSEHMIESYNEGPAYHLRADKETQ